jgi:hypothetical protein
MEKGLREEQEDRRGVLMSRLVNVVNGLNPSAHLQLLGMCGSLLRAIP